MFVKKQVFLPVTTAFKNVSTSITQLQTTITEDQMFTIQVSIYFNINRHHHIKNNYDSNENTVPHRTIIFQTPHTPFPTNKVNNMSEKLWRMTYL